MPPECGLGAHCAVWTICAYSCICSDRVCCLVVDASVGDHLAVIDVAFLNVCVYGSSDEPASDECSNASVRVVPRKLV